GGGGGANQSLNQGRLFIGLKPRDQRKNVDEIIADLRPKLARVPGMVVFMQNPPAIQIGGRVAKSLYQFTMQSSDVATLYPAAQKLVDAARKSPLLLDVTSDLQLGNPQASIEIDRERAASLGVSASQIETALYDAYGSRQVSTVTQSVGPVAVNHAGQLPSVTLSFNLRPGVALGNAVADVQHIANNTLP